MNYDKITFMIVGTQHRTKNIQPLNISSTAAQLEMLKTDITGRLYEGHLESS